MTRIEWPIIPAISQWLADVQDAARPGSRVQNAVRGDIARIVREDHERKMFTGIDRYGRQRAPLSPRTLANPKRGPGPSLIPRNRASRYITTFTMLWTYDSAGGTANRMILSLSFRGFTSPSGFPIPLAHEHGAKRGNWVLPARPVMGITPQGMALIDDRIRQFATEIARGHR